MHSQIDKEEVVERYVGRRLAADERQAFEEHFFGCDECFEKVQEAERFRAGIRDASARGLFGAESPAAFDAGPGRWLRWAFAATACTSVTLAVLAGWMYFGQIPRLRDELNREAARVTVERQARDELARTVNPAEGAEANVALVMLQASRAAEKLASITLPPAARRLILWIDIGQSRFRTFRMEVTAPDTRVIASLDHLTRGPYGALAVSLPADKLPTGSVRITLSGEDPPPIALVGDYQLSVQKR